MHHRMPGKAGALTRHHDVLRAMVSKGDGVLVLLQVRVLRRVRREVRHIDISLQNCQLELDGVQLPRGCLGERVESPSKAVNRSSVVARSTARICASSFPWRRMSAAIFSSI